MKNISQRFQISSFYEFKRPRPFGRIGLTNASNWYASNDFSFIQYLLFIVSDANEWTNGDLKSVDMPLLRPR